MLVYSLCAWLTLFRWTARRRSNCCSCQLVDALNCAVTVVFGASFRTNNSSTVCENSEDSLGFVTAATSFTGGQPNFARSLAVSWAGTLYTHFRELLPLAEFCQMQNSLCVQILRSPILAALLHGTAAADVSQTLRLGTRNGITELSQRVPPIFA